jgi:hypothetical protein
LSQTRYSETHTSSKISKKATQIKAQQTRQARIKQISKPLINTNMNQSQSKSVFISHSSKDADIANEICTNLETMGVSCWIAPRDIKAGQNYGEAIIIGIEKCSAVIFLMTDESNRSPAVESEIERAFSYQKIIIPIRLKNISPSKKIEFYVAKSQWIDAILEPLKKRLHLVKDVVQAIETNYKIPEIPAEKRTMLGSLERFIESRLRHKVTSALAGFIILATLGSATLFLQQRSTSVVTAASESIATSSGEISRAATGISSLSNQIGNIKKETSENPRKELQNNGIPWDYKHVVQAVINSDNNTLELFLLGGMPINGREVINLFSKKNINGLNLIQAYPALFKEDTCKHIFSGLVGSLQSNEDRSTTSCINGTLSPGRYYCTSNFTHNGAKVTSHTSEHIKPVLNLCKTFDFQSEIKKEIQNLRSELTVAESEHSQKIAEKKFPSLNTCIQDALSLKNDVIKIAKEYPSSRWSLELPKTKAYLEDIISALKQDEVARNHTRSATTYEQNVKKRCEDADSENKPLNAESNSIKLKTMRIFQEYISL